MSREDIGLAGLPVGVEGLDILALFFLFLFFLYTRGMEREERKRKKGVLKKRSSLH